MPCSVPRVPRVLRRLAERPRFVGGSLFPPQSELLSFIRSLIVALLRIAHHPGSLVGRIESKVAPLTEGREKIGIFGHFTLRRL